MIPLRLRAAWCSLMHSEDYWPVGILIRCKVCHHERLNPCALFKVSA